MAAPGRAPEGSIESRASPPIAPRTIPSITSIEAAPSLTSGPNQPSLLASPRAQRTPPKTAHLSPKPGHTGLTYSTSGLRLTGAAAMAEMKRAASKSPMTSRQTSPNPAAEVLQTLVGGGGMSRPSDAPASTKLSEPLRQVAEKVIIPSTTASADSEQVSPVSLGSFGTVESSGARSALTATAGEPTTTLGQPFVAEPAQMTDEAAPSGSDNLTVADQDGNKAFSYPGPPPGSAEQSRPPSSGLSRGMSLPGYGQGSPKSPASGKRHKCPYCDTDFTRHHNLKSHLLTHSQEKPYICQTCQSRFRRLHDLKRHTKLHTGERPHTCDKCGRRFARGDALARHNKGPGGCAGRRSSFGGDDDYTDGPSEVMDGVEFTGDSEAYETAEDHARRVSEPSRKRHQPEMPGDPSRQVYRQPSTYPPPPSRNPRDNASNMAPPTVVHPGSTSSVPSSQEPLSHSTSANGSSLNSSSYYSQGQVFNEPGLMTSSPKPLSPGPQSGDSHRLSVSESAGPGTLGRHRSTSLTTQFQQQHFGRGSTGKTSPRLASQYAPNTQQPAGSSTMLPPLNASQQSRGTLPPVGPASGSSSLQHSQQGAPAGPPGSNPGSLSSHGRSSIGSMREAMGTDQGDIWAYVRQIEARFERMKNEYELRIQNLQEEVNIIRAQLSGAPNYSSGGGGGSGGGGEIGSSRY